MVTAAPNPASLPPGSVLVEAEHFARCEWFVLDEPEASGGQWIRCNQPDWIAETTLELPPGRYTVWVRCTDDGHYPGHYSYRVTLDGAEYGAATTEPLAYRWCWEKLGSVEGGLIHVQLDQADTWNTACDCFLFSTDLEFRPSGAPRLRLMDARLDLSRSGGIATVSFAGHPLDAQPRECWLALRGASGNDVPKGNISERQVIWSKRLGTDALLSSPDVGGNLTARFEIPPLQFAPEGRYALTLELGDCQWIGREEGDHTVTEALLGPHEIPRPCVVDVRTHRGTPSLFVNGRPIFPFAFLGVNTGHYGEFGAQGAHLYSAGCGLGNQQPGAFDPTEPDQMAQDVLSRDPEALILPRIQLEPPSAWLDAHPAERVVFDDGTIGPQSFASQAWLDLICDDLRRYVEHVRTSPYADRIIGLHLCTGYSAEWQSWGLWDGRRGDFSEPFRRFFHDWLRERYNSDEALTSAWSMPEVTLSSASIPQRSRREQPPGLLWDPVRDRQVLDFFAAYPLAASRAITRVARAVKEASEGEMIVGVFYGYGLQYGPLAQESQHLALREVLECPDVDFLCAPAMYSDRAPGGTSTFMSVTDSVKLHGKLWLSESDIRTHLQQDQVGRCVDMQQTLGVLKREYAAVRARGVGQWWFDMQDGWFSDPAILTLFGEMNRLGQEGLKGPPAPLLAPEIALVLSERSAVRHGAGALGDFYFVGMTAQTATANRVGAPVAVYLLADIEQMPDVRMIVFLNAFDLTARERVTIEKLKSRDRMLLFVHAAGIGSVDERGGVTQDLSRISELVEQEVEEVASGPFRVSLAADPLCEGLHYANEGFAMNPQAYGPSIQGGPRFAVRNAERVLGTYEDGQAALALAHRGRWTSAYSASPGLPPGLLRNLARVAGVHVYCESEDAFYAGQGLVALHASEGGRKEVVLPRKMTVREVLTDAPIKSAGRRIRFTAEQYDTRVFEVR